MTDLADRHIVVTGEMGVGKTTVGDALAARLGTAFYDSDRVLESNEGRSGAEIAAAQDVAVLHEAELAAFETMLATDAGSVLAPAASVVDSPKGREWLGDVFVVWLTAPDAVLAERQKTGDHRRAVTRRERAELRSRRRPHLELLADLTLDTGDSRPEDVVELIVSAIASDNGQRSS